VKTFFTVVVILVVFYGIYTVGLLGYEWFQVSNLVDDVVETALPRMAGRGEGERTGELTRVRSAIVSRMEQIGVVIDERAVDVWEQDRFVEVQVRWDFPIVAALDSTLFMVPLSVERSFNLARAVR
jgi:hypothetical protein